jgi:AAA15 family ATPase/GTPase
VDRKEGNMRLKSIYIDKFRTFEDFHLKDIYNLQLITGVNNSGKTNFLRALDLFFNNKIGSESYNKRDDLPYQIGRITRAGKAKTYIEAEIVFSKDEIERWLNNKKDVKREYFTRQGKEWVVRLSKSFRDEVELHIFNNDGTAILVKPGSKESIVCRYVFNRIRYFFMPSNIDVNEIIRDWLIEETLSISMDSFGREGEYRAKVAIARKAFKNFIGKMELILEESNKELSELLRNVLRQTPLIAGKIPVENWETKIEFPSEVTLINTIKEKTVFSLEDGLKNMPIESKGSGLQKTSVILLMKYILDSVHGAQRFNRKLFIWGIDEPELNMQPSLQKTIFSELEILSKENQIILATHSPHFIDLYNHADKVTLFDLDSYLGTFRDQSVFVKKTKFYDAKTDKSEFFKSVKLHLGVSLFDTWQIMKTNFLLEGFCDKQYLASLYNSLTGKSLKGSLLIAGGASLMPAYVSLIESLAEEEKEKMVLKAVFDNDKEGNTSKRKIKNKSYAHIKRILFSTESLYNGYSKNNCESEIEDMAIPEVYWESVCDWLEKAKAIKRKRLPSFNKFKIAREKFIKDKMTDFLNTWLVAMLDGQLDRDLITLENVKAYISMRFAKRLETLDSLQKMDYLNRYKSLNDLFKFLSIK